MCWKSEGLNLGLTFSLAAPQLFWKLTKRLNYQGELVYLNAFLQVVNIQKKKKYARMYSQLSLNGDMKISGLVGG